MLPVIRSKYKHENLLEKLFGGELFDFTPLSNDVIHTTNEDGQMIMEIEVPGFNKDNLNVELSDGILTISGKTDTRQVNRQYTIGAIEDVKASVKDGILSLTLIEPQKNVKRVEFIE